MREDTAYDLSNDALIDRLIKATQRIAIHNSGLCITAGAGYDAIDFQYVRGALMARLEGKRPPLRPGQVVRLARRNEHQSKGWPDPPRLEYDKDYRIDRVFYEGNGFWTFMVSGVEPFGPDGRICGRYRVEAFTPVETE